MTEQTKKTLEERTQISDNIIKKNMEYAGEMFMTSIRDEPSFQALYTQNLALYEQNKIIIDYLQEIYKAQTGKRK